MFETNYQPKFFKSINTEINRVGNKTVFTFKNVFGESKEICVDQTVELIKSRMEDVKNGIRERIYLTYIMSNIDIDLLSNGNWQLFDEFDLYEFAL
jgi:hypothetical protein